MRCFYCSRQGQRRSDEHIPSASLGSRLRTRKVCIPCNGRASTEIDTPIAEHLMIAREQALADVRNVRKQSRPPAVDTTGIVSGSGESVDVRFSPGGFAAMRPDGSAVEETVEIEYGGAVELWPRFIAKVALGCASKVMPESWL